MKNTVSTFLSMKQNGERLTEITSYDYTTAKLVEKAGINAILVGDSLGMTMMGYDTTLPVTMEDMIHHSACVVRACENTMLIMDMPFMSYNLTVEQGLENASKMIKAGASGVKLEGCNEHILKLVRRCVESGIPVLGHLGFTPQLMNTIGGHKIQGKTSEKIEQILESAKKLEEAGCFAIVLELMPSDSAKYITENLKVPTIGIGAGKDCSGQIVVTDDILGKFTDFTPKFVKKYANLHETVSNSVSMYIREVKGEIFPSERESFKLDERERGKLNL